LRRYVCALAFMSLLGAWPTTHVHADVATPDVATPDRATEDAQARARDHYAAGLRAYNIGDFDLAIREWKAGYRLHGSPDFLFNIAQAYRGSRDYERALFFFNAYLRERPDAPNSDEVRELRDEMNRLREEERASREKPPNEPIDPTHSDVPREPGEVVPTVAEAPPPPEPPPGADLPEATATPTSPPSASADGRALKWSGMIAGGTGVALFATGIALSGAASSAEGDLEAAALRGDPWTEELRRKDARASRHATVARALFTTGSLAIVGGGVAYYLGYQRDDRRWGLAVAPSLGGGAGINVSWGLSL
jgi:tetratricopeptide (TPR) repeat protein